MTITSDSARAVITHDGLDELIQALRRAGRTVVGPTARDGVITHAEILAADDLPQGWTEQQEGGTYRLESTGTDEVFAFSSPSASWKRYVYPERTLLIFATRNNGTGTVTVHEPGTQAPAMAFFGIRSCDLAGLSVLDDVFADPAASDPSYRAVRDDAFIVAAACGHPGNTCFCASMGTGPSPRTGFDLALVEIYDDDGHRYLVEAGSERGQALLSEVKSEPASSQEVVAADGIHDTALESMGRSLSPADPPLAAENLDDPVWDDVAERCLACGNCTMVCPTCFCGRTEDVTDLTGAETERFRVWDSCFTLDFTHLPAGPVRTSTKSRYRHWLLHKLVTWHDQFGRSGCVGCGRCITWCPVGIDLTAEIAALAEAQRRETSQETAGTL